MLCVFRVVLTINTVQTGIINIDCKRNQVEIQLLIDVITDTVKDSKERPHLLL